MAAGHHQRFLLRLCYCFGISQLVNKPTRGEASLDLILANTPAHLANVEIDCGLGNSDHNVVCFDFNVFIMSFMSL